MPKKPKKIAKMILAWSKNAPIQCMIDHSRHMKHLKKKHSPADAAREHAEPLTVTIGERVRLD